MEDYSKAISAYNDALSTGKDEFSTPSIMLKLALAYEADGKKEKALETLKQLKSDYPNNSEALSVEKGIARLNQ
jgi:TolA-binding protein